jgi:signal transduction histidine kinase
MKLRTLQSDPLPATDVDRFRLNIPMVFAGLVTCLLGTIFFLVTADFGSLNLSILLIICGIILIIAFNLFYRRALSATRLTNSSSFNDEFRQLSESVRLLVENPESSLAYNNLLMLAAARVNGVVLAIYCFEERSGLLSLLAVSAENRDENTSDFYPQQISPATLHMIDQSDHDFTDIGNHFKLRSCYGIGLYDDEALFGVVTVNRKVSDSDEIGLLKEFSSQISKIICSGRRAQISRRQDLYQERSVIARELHDSLAQSLTYLKIQLTRLQTHIDKNKSSESSDYSQIENAILELRSHLSLAYGQLRELMTTFRLTMNGKDLRNAIDESINEFKQRTNIAFDSDIRISGEELNAQEELQLLQIVREALSNVVRHSRASRASISLGMQGDLVILSLSDNGVGLADIPGPGQHHGLVIMQERTQRLNGDLQVNNLDPTGTRVQVSFSPESRVCSKSTETS